MTASRAPRRRDLSALLAVGALSPALLAGCAGRGVATAEDVPRDPLAERVVADPELWDSRSTADLLARPVTDGEGHDLSAAREELVRFVAAAYLSPEELRLLDDAATIEHLHGETPFYWQDQLIAAWERKERYFYAHSPAGGFRTVGSPAICSAWFRQETGATPLLLLGATIAYTLIETATRRVAVIAFRVGIRAELDPDGAISTASLRVTLHGMDLCTMGQGRGQTIPAIEDDPAHESARSKTARLVLDAPRISREDLTDDDSAILTGDETTNALC